MSLGAQRGDLGGRERLDLAAVERQQRFQCGDLVGRQHGQLVGAQRHARRSVVSARIWSVLSAINWSLFRALDLSGGQRGDVARLDGVQPGSVLSWPIMLVVSAATWAVLNSTIWSVLSARICSAVSAANWALLRATRSLGVQRDHLVGGHALDLRTGQRQQRLHRGNLVGGQQRQLLRRSAPAGDGGAQRGDLVGAQRAATGRR
jgi:hypothetical protein